MGSLGFAWRVCRMLDHAANAASDAEVQRATVLLAPTAWRGGPAGFSPAGSVLPPPPAGSKLSLSSMCTRAEHFMCWVAQARCNCFCHGRKGQQPPDRKREAKS